MEYTRWAIILDLCVLALFWPIIRSPEGKWTTWVLRATGISSVIFWMTRLFFSATGHGQKGRLLAFIQRFNSRPSGLPMIEGILSLITVIIVIGFSWGVAVLPDSENEKWVAQWFNNATKDKGLGEFDIAWLSEKPSKKEGKFYFRLTEYLFDRIYLMDNSDQKLDRESIFHRNLRLREKLLIANELKPEDVARLTDNDEKATKEVLRKIVGLNLKGRDLRYADFSGSLMPKVDFREINGVYTNLKNADFQRVKLYKARMSEAHLQGADLANAHLQGVDLTNGYLQGVDLQDAQLQGANLQDAQLQGADLSNAQLQGANLEDAHLQGADMEDVQLQGANLVYAQLQGADLDGARLQGANLGYAQLQGANLVWTHFEAANMGGAHFEAANLEYAHLISLDTDSATFGKITEQYIENLLKGLSSTIKDTKLLKEIKDILTKAKKRSSSLVKAREENIWKENEVFDEIMQKASKDSKEDLEFSYSELDYQNGLVDYFIKLSCENPWVASGIISYRAEYMPLKKSFAQCLLSLKDKNNKSVQFNCPGMSEINKESLDKIEKMASTTEPENNTQTVFKCEI